MPVTDEQRREVLAAAEAVAAALERYCAAIGPVAAELPDGQPITDTAKLWATLFAGQVESWRHHRAAKAAN